VLEAGETVIVLPVPNDVPVPFAPEYQLIVALPAEVPPLAVSATVVFGQSGELTGTEVIGVEAGLTTKLTTERQAGAPEQAT
jgi:hypothetical protein